MSHLFTSDDQNTGASASASVLLVNIQGWSPLGLTGWYPCCPRDFEESSSTTVWSHQFFSIQLHFTKNKSYYEIMAIFLCAIQYIPVAYILTYFKCPVEVVALSTFTLLYNHHHCSSFQTVYPLNNNFPLYAPPMPWELLFYFLSLWIWPF